MAQLPPAGWHPDPLGRHAQRYWDGQQWTEHVADQAGNMSTDPLDGGGQAQQGQQAATTQDSTRDSSTQGNASWGTESGGAASWGTESGGGAQWGAEPTDTTTAHDQAAHAEPAEAEQAPAGGFESAWGAAAGGAAVAGTAAAARSEPQHAASPDTAAHDDTSAAMTDEAATDASAGSAAPTGEDDEDGQAWATGVMAFEVDDADPILAVPSAIVARQPGVTATEGEDGDHLAGSGTVWLGGAGRDVTVVTLQSPGLTVDRAALVAHSAGLSREDAHPGIVGFAGVRLSGAGWVALAAAGGLTEVPTHGGVEVASSALVAFTNDLDVSHADTVGLSGAGVALVSGG